MLTTKILKFIRLLIVFSFCLSIYACGGGGGGSVGASANSTGVSSGNTTGGTGGTAGGSGTGNASFQILWNAPVQYTDGSPLNLANIASYTIRYGTQSGNYNYSIVINDPTATSYSVTGLPHGKYFVIITVKLLDGRESVYSNEVTRTI